MIDLNNLPERSSYRYTITAVVTKYNIYEVMNTLLDMINSAANEHYWLSSTVTSIAISILDGSNKLVDIEIGDTVKMHICSGCVFPFEVYSKGYRKYCTTVTRDGYK